MEDYRLTLKKAGTILIVVGAIDIACMIAVVASGGSYSSSLNVFALAAGIFLRRGSLQTTRLVSRFGAFLLAGCGVALVIILPESQPMALWVVQFRLHPLNTLLPLLLVLAIYPLLVHAYRLLRRPEVIDALKQAGLQMRPLPWFAMGAGLALLVGIMMHTMLHGESAGKAVEIARARYGAQYQYTVTQLSASSSGGTATVTAYKEDEIRSVPVSW